MKRQLLFVDDNPMMGGFLSHLFGKDYQVIWRDSIESAFDSLESEGIPDLIICDYQLADNTGYNLLRKLKRTGQTN